MDGVIPTSRLPDVLRRIGEMRDAYGLKVANIFHAGDGNLHPLIMFDANDPASFHKAEKFGADILKLCVEMGGCLTGEHGVGVEKRDLMPVQFNAQNWTSSAASSRAFDPDWLLNPNKVFPLADNAPRRRRHERRAGADRGSGDRRRPIAEAAAAQRAAGDRRATAPSPPCCGRCRRRARCRRATCPASRCMRRRN